MAVNKVEFAGKALVDLTGDTVSPTSLLAGSTAHDKAGRLIEGAVQVPEVDSTLSSTSTNPVQNKAVNAALANKVDKVSGKGLSTNDFTTAYKNKLDGVKAGAEANVQPDWGETDASSDAYIKNKPNIPQGVAVDSVLSSTSTNPVQNKVIANNFVPGYVSTKDITFGAGGVGWYRVAEARVWGANSCVVSMKRRYNNPAPEYQKVQLLNAYDRHKFVSLAALSQTHIWTKIREVKDNSTNKAYIDIYQGVQASNNACTFSIEDALGVGGTNWKVVEPVKVQEAAEGFTVLASLDLPANFDLGYLDTNKANVASPTFTGTPKAPTPAQTENSTRIATTAYVKAVVSALVNGAPGTLDTLKELADAIEDHQEVTDALNAAIGNKVDKVSGKGLSTNDFTTTYKNKLDGIAEGAQVNTPADGALSATSTNPVQNRVVDAALERKLDKSGGTLEGDLRLETRGGYGAKINFGDGDFAYVHEDTDDHLEIYAEEGINLKGKGLTFNGTPVASAWRHEAVLFKYSERCSISDAEEVEELTLIIREEEFESSILGTFTIPCPYEICRMHDAGEMLLYTDSSKSWYVNLAAEGGTLGISNNSHTAISVHCKVPV